MQWEFKQIGADSDKRLLRMIAEDGLLGWEPCFVCLGEVYAILKRPKPTPEVTPQDTQQDTQQVEYITPKAEHVGQMVEVRDHDYSEWQPPRELLAVLPCDMSDRFIARSTAGSCPVAWKQARVAVK